MVTSIFLGCFVMAVVTPRRALLLGAGSTTFAHCEFVQWDLQKKDGRAAIRAQAGTVLLQGNHFAEDKKQVELGAHVAKAVVMGNILTGDERIHVASNATVVRIGLNA